MYRLYVLSRRLLPLLGCSLLLIVPLACVDPEDILLRGTVNVMVVDGTITNLAEPQLIKLNRSRADPLTGRFGFLPITNAKVTVVVDSAQFISANETVSGTYQLPGDFRGRVGHAYQLQIVLSDGTQYRSMQQIMPHVPAIDKLTVRFNATSLAVGLYPNRFQAGYDCFVNTQDPPEQRNYYRWDWKLWEKQKWCRSCYQGIYSDTIQQSYLQNGGPVYIKKAIEDCVAPSVKPNIEFWNDYTCRSQCWDIIQNYFLNLFDDQLTNGSQITGRRVAQVPFFTRQPALLEIRQVSLTADAYRYFKLFQQQTQNTGGLGDTPPTAIVGNVKNLANSHEAVVGYFTASAVSSIRYWQDKKDATRLPLGAYDDRGKIVQGDDELFYVQNRRVPTPGPEGPPFMAGGPTRFITAPCIPSEGRSPLKPDGWRD